MDFQWIEIDLCIFNQSKINISQWNVSVGIKTNEWTVQSSEKILRSNESCNRRASCRKYLWCIRNRMMLGKSFACNIVLNHISIHIIYPLSWLRFFFAAAQKTGKGFIYIRIIYISMPRMRAPVEQKSILHFQHVYLWFYLWASGNLLVNSHTHLTHSLL